MLVVTKIFPASQQQVASDFVRQVTCSTQILRTDPRQAAKSKVGNTTHKIIKSWIVTLLLQPRKQTHWKIS